MEEQHEYPNYRPTSKEAQTIDRIDTRFNDMRNTRRNVDKDRWIYQQMIDAVYTPYPDERSSSVVPLSSSIIELYVADCMKLQTEYNFRGETSKHNTQAKALEYVWKYDYRRNNRKKTFIDNEYITAGFGTSVIYTGYESYTKEQSNPIIGDDMSIDWEKETITEVNIIVKNIDIRDYYVDDQAIEGIEDAVDCIYDQWIAYDRFKSFKTNPFYKNIDKVSSTQYSNENRPYTVEEQQSKQGKFVKLRHYWNVENDEYIVVANGVIVREHPMISTIDGKKALPFVIRRLGKKNNSIYGRGICEALMMFNSEVNNLRELLMDGIRRSNTQVLAIGNGLSFNGRNFSYDNEILEFDGNLAQNFQQLSGNPPNQAIFSYISQLYKDIAIYVGIDIQNIIGNSQQTAYQTEVQREASQKRINVWLGNRDSDFERFANLYKDLLQRYFPLKTAEGIYKTIEIEDEELIGEGETKRFRKKKGKSMFEVTPEMLRGDIYIDVYTNFSSSTLNAVAQENKMNFFQKAPLIAQWYATAKQMWADLESVLPLKQAINDLAASMNIETIGTDDDSDVKAAKNKLMSELQTMLQRSQWTLQQPWAEVSATTWTEQAPQQQPQPQETQTMKQPSQFLQEWMPQAPKL